MTTVETFDFLADVVLIAHFAIVLFVVGGLAIIIIGNHLRWSWVNMLWFRISHLATIGIVVAESWLGIACPLTTLENWLRTKAGQTSYNDSFIAHFLQRLIFYNAPEWIFIVAYTIFGLCVFVAWWRFPPKP